MKNTFKTVERTTELKNILRYIEDVLLLEAPNHEIGIEYMITAILDEDKCHAHFIIEECIMSDSVDQLRTIYDDFLKSRTNNVIVKDPKYTTEFNDILKFAEEETHKSGSKYTGTEHVLLAMLNKDSNVSKKTLDILNSVGLSYPIVLGKCVEIQKQVDKITKNKKKQEDNKQTSKSLMDDILPKQQNITTSSSTIQTSNNTILSKYTTNLTQLAREGKLTPLIGRERELKQIVKTLARKKKNNVVLVGESGCGKTQIGYGLANLIASTEVPEYLEGKEMLLLNIMSLVSGTHLRGMFEERVRNLFDELKKSKKYILFIDNMQYALKSNSKDNDADLSSVLTDVLNEGDVRIIGAVTPKAYHKSIEHNQSIASKMQKIMIEPLSINETIEVLNLIKTDYEAHHNVFYPLNVVKQAVKLAERYITDRCLPDSAIDVIDLCGAQTILAPKANSNMKQLKERINAIKTDKVRALTDYDFTLLDELCEEEKKIKLEVANLNKEYANKRQEYQIEITENDVAQVISDMCGIPTSNLSIDEKKKIAHMDEILKKSVIGQDEAVDAICKAIKRNKVGLNNPNKPLLTALCIGPSGTGKTLVAKKLAQEIYGDENALIRIDMSEYSEKNSVTKLTGSAPGYVGYDQGGQLTEAIKNKQYCVLLLDEIEKADESIYNVFLQLFDEGRLTDSSGVVVNFKNVVILMTSNVGAKKASELGGGIGFNSSPDSNKKSIVDRELRKKFTPEFLNRIDKIVHFNFLTDENLYEIVKLESYKFIKRMNDLGFNVSISEEVYDKIHKMSLEKKEYGARPIIRLIQDNIEDKVTEMMLENDYEKGKVFEIFLENNEIKIE